MRQVIDREQLFDVLGEASDKAYELVKESPWLADYGHGASDALTLVFDLLARKFPAEEGE